jgi:hypothetical protein
MRVNASKQKSGRLPEGMTFKKAAWKDAIGFFFVMLAASFIWNLIGSPKESAAYIFGVAAIGAVLMYVFKGFV